MTQIQKLSPLVTMGRIRKWFTDSKTVIDADAHPGGTTSLIVHADRVFSGGNDRLIRSWKFPMSVSKKRPEIESVFVGHTDQISCMSLAPKQGLLVTGDLERMVRIWDLETGEMLSVVRRHTSHVRRVEFGPHGRWLVTAGDDRVNSCVASRPTGGEVAARRVRRILS